MTTVLLVVGILVFLIVVHELGHFFAAKIFKVRVEEFGVGYPPRAFTFGHWGGTEYTLNWLPFGGFVRLFGESESAPGEGPGRVRSSFIGAPRYVQALILVAGVFMNAIAAWALFASALYVGIPHAVPSDSDAANTRLLVSQVVSQSPASAAGLAQGDEVLSIRDSQGEAAELRPDDVVAFVSERGGKELEIVFLHGTEEQRATVHPANAVITEEAQRPALGVGLVLVTSEPVGLGEAFISSFPITLDRLYAVVEGIVGIFTNAFRGGAVLDGIVGPVGLVGVVGNAAEHGLGSVLVLAGFISLNLTIINLLPIPALDGGRLVLLGVEAAMRRSAPRLSVQLLNAVGVGLIVVLMLSVTYNDIARLLS